MIEIVGGIIALIYIAEIVASVLVSVFMEGD